MVKTLASAENRPPISLKVVNLDLPENEHYAQDFQITFNTVVVAEIRDGKPLRWKNLSDIWGFSQDETSFRQYLASEFGAFFKSDR